MSVITCYLIGGAPLSGKTTLSKIWAAEHQATQISTDSIREWMQRLTHAQDYPRLFYSQGLSVEDYYRTYDTAEKAMRAEIHQGKDVEKGIEALLKSELTIERLIIEGIAIPPEFVAHLRTALPNVHFKATFLFDDNRERIARRIHQRGLWAAADTYPDYIKDKEVDWVVLYNEFYEAEAERYGMPLVHIDSLAGV